MNYGSRGGRTSHVEVTNVSPHGFWLLVGSRELFASFDAFPWFKDATIAELTRVELIGNDVLHWPQLDADVAVESIEHPERYPLVSRMPMSRTSGAGAASAVREKAPGYKTHGAARTTAARKKATRS